jgi:NTE family protein
MAKVAEQASPFWWEVFPADARWHGVFQGGGAKGVAYGGSLLAMKAESQWFCSVAGSSAGALTAALIAAGFTPDEMIQMTEEMLASVGPDTLLDHLFHMTPVVRRFTRYDARGLERNLELRLREGVERHGGQGTGDVTFADLDSSTGISLNVLGLDATLGRPIPFCVERTPFVSVSAAVASSCAIPLVFPPRYVELDSHSAFDFPPLRRVVDGGAWANFPMFIYQDEGFRAFFDLPSLPADRKVIGFVLGLGTPPLAAAPKRFIVDPYKIFDPLRIEIVMKRYDRDELEDDDAKDQSPAVAVEDDDDHISLRENLRWRLGLLKRAVPSLSVLGLVVIMYLILIVNGITAVGSSRWWFAALCAIGVVLLTGISLAVWRIVRSLSREGLDTLRSLVGLATTPAVWAGLMPHVTIIWVPTSGLGTTEFRPGNKRTERAIHNATETCSEQLREALKGATFYQINTKAFRESLAEISVPDLSLDIIPTYSSGLGSSRRAHPRSVSRPE